jgi:hypothetical protein
MGDDAHFLSHVLTRSSAVFSELRLLSPVPDSRLGDPGAIGRRHNARQVSRDYGGQLLTLGVAAAFGHL